jgi:hypothetical protein
MKKLYLPILLIVSFLGLSPFVSAEVLTIGQNSPTPSITFTGPQIRFLNVVPSAQNSIGFNLDTGTLSTNDHQPTFTGIAKPNTQIQIFEKFDHSLIVNDVETFTPIYGTTISDSSGNWHITPPFNTTDGTLSDAKYNFVACEVENNACVKYTEDFHLIVDSNLDIENISLQEIKVYDKDVITTMQPLSEMSMIVYGSGYDGKPATEADGYNVQAYIFLNGTTQNYLTPNPEGSYNGTYDADSDGWKIKMNVPAVAGEYYLRTVLYCAQRDSRCWQMEHSIAPQNEPEIITPFTIEHSPVVRSISEDTGTSNTDFITKDNTPNFYGTANPNTTIDVYSWSMAPCPVITPGATCTYAALLLGRTTSNQDGYWSLENTNTIHLDGQYQIFAHAIIGQEVFIGSSTVMIIDTGAPSVPVITSPISQESKYSNSIEVSGVCSEEGALILLTLEDVSLYKGDEYPKLGNYLGFGTQCIEGKFTTAISNDLQPFSPVNVLATVKFAAVQIDSAENMSEMSNIITLTHSEAVINSITNEIKLDNQFHIVDNRNPKFYGTAQPNSKVQLFEVADHLAIIEGVERYTAVYAVTNSDDKGNFVFEVPFTTIDGSLELGEHHFLVCEVIYDICDTDSASHHRFSVKIVEQNTPSGGGGGGGGGGGNPPPLCNILGDINCDQKVNKYDFALMMMAWGLKTSDKADLNNDIKVDKYDFALLMSNWGYGEVKR